MSDMLSVTLAVIAASGIVGVLTTLMRIAAALERLALLTENPPVTVELAEAPPPENMTPPNADFTPSQRATINQAINNAVDHMRAEQLRRPRRSVL